MPTYPPFWNFPPTDPAVVFSVLGWIVSDIGKTVGELRRRGVRFRLYDGMDQDELGIWSAPDGARVAWLVDPWTRTVTVHRSGSDPETLRDAEELSADPYLPGFRVAVAIRFG